MGRNKKKSKAAAHATSESDEEREDAEVHDAAAVTTPRDNGEAAKGAGDAAAGQHSGHHSEHEGSDSDGEDAPKKKKKEYKGNRLKKQEPKGKKNKGKGAAVAAAAATTAEGQAAGSGEDEASDAPEDTRVQPIDVLYCPHCSFPAEFCEFGGMMEKCRPWLLEHAAELADAEDRGRKRRILTEKDRLAALMEGRGIKKALDRVIVIEVEKRTGKRMITSVFGMDLFGFNMKDLSRDWRKRFSCGAGVRAAEEGKHQDCIDVQGNVLDDLAEMLVTKYEIPKTAVFMMEGKKKVPYPY